MKFTFRKYSNQDRVAIIHIFEFKDGAGKEVSDWIP